MLIVSSTAIDVYFVTVDLAVCCSHMKHGDRERSGATRLLHPEVWLRSLNLCCIFTLAWRSERIQFELGVTLHRCLWNKAPVYLMDCCSRVADIVGRRHLRSASQHVTGWVPLVARAFAVFADPTTCNSLPDMFACERGELTIGATAVGTGETGPQLLG